MFRIGEFSKLTQVSIRMLRYYDENGLLIPAMIDQESGYRLYSADQIPDLQRIVLLRDSRFSIEEMKQLLTDWDEEKVIVALERKKKEILDTIAMEQARVKMIEAAGQDIKQKKQHSKCSIGFKKVDPVNILSYREKIPTYFDEGLLWAKLAAFTEKEHIKEKSRVYGNVTVYHDIDHKEENVDVEVGIVVDQCKKEKDGFTYRTLDGVGRMAYAMVYGPYENLAKAYEEIAYWLEEHDEVMADLPSRQISHIGAYNTDNEEEYLTEIQIPLISD